MSEKFCRNRAEWEKICQKKSHPGSANAHVRTLADHVLGLDVFRAALWREVNNDALALDLPGDLPFLPVLVGAADEGLASVDCDLARAAGMGRVLGSVFKKLGLKEGGRAVISAACLPITISAITDADLIRLLDTRPRLAQNIFQKSTHLSTFCKLCKIVYPS